MWPAGAGGLALVDHCKQMVESLRPGSLGDLRPGLGDERELRIGKIGKRAQMGRRVHDYLLPLESGEEIGNHANLPTRRVG